MSKPLKLTEKEIFTLKSFVFKLDHYAIQTVDIVNNLGRVDRLARNVDELNMGVDALNKKQHFREKLYVTLAAVFIVILIFCSGFVVGQAT